MTYWGTTATEEVIMSEQAQALAERFERANGALIGTLQQCSEADWRKSCQAEGWTVAATGHHVAGAHEPIAGFVQMIATGQQLPPLTMEQLHQMNAQHAQEFASCDKAETVELLRRNGTAAANVVRGLSDEQLSRSAPMPLMGGAQVSARQMIENVLIGHLQEHSGSIRSALGV
jgi:uncharacterized damage-inducible protein DinB